MARQDVLIKGNLRIGGWKNGEMVKLAETNAFNITKQMEVAAVKRDLEMVKPDRIADFILRGKLVMALAMLKQHYALVIIVPHWFSPSME